MTSSADGVQSQLCASDIKKVVRKSESSLRRKFDFRVSFDTEKLFFLLFSWVSIWFACSDCSVSL